MRRQNESFTVLGVVGCGAGVFVDEAVLESAIDENGKLSGGSGDGLGFTDAVSESSEVSAESGLSSAKAHGRHTKDGGGAVGRGLSSGAEKPSAGDFVLRSEGEPGREVFFDRPTVHVGSDLGDKAEGGIGSVCDKSDPLQSKQ